MDEFDGRQAAIGDLGRPIAVSLRRVLEDGGPLTAEQSLGIAGNVLERLEKPHESGLVHGDVCPDNVIVDLDGEVRLSDVGLAPTRPGPLGAPAVGSPAYMSPEAASGKTLDPRADLYSVGAMLFELLCGSAPYPGSTPLGTMIRQMSLAVPDPVEINPNLPPGVAGLVTKAMAKSADDRPQTADAFRRDLQVAAVNGYGEGWEERRSISRRVAATLPQLPSSAAGLALVEPTAARLGAAVAAGGARSRLSQRSLVAAGAAGGLALVSLGGGMSLVLLNSRPSPGPTGGVLAIGANNLPSSPTPSASLEPSSSPSPSPSPSPSASAAPTSGPTQPPQAGGTVNPPPPPPPVETPAPSPSPPEPSPSPSPSDSPSPSPSASP